MERFIDRHDLVARGLAGIDRRDRAAVEGDLHLAAPLLRTPLARMVDQDPAHRLGGDPEEVRPALPVDRALVDDPEEGLVDQCRGGQGVLVALAAKLARGKALELIVDHRDEPVDCPRLPLRCLAKESGDVGGAGFHGVPRYSHGTGVCARMG